jgi:hypothetical protein
MLFRSKYRIIMEVFYLRLNNLIMITDSFSIARATAAANSMAGYSIKRISIAGIIITAFIVCGFISCQPAGHGPGAGQADPNAAQASPGATPAAQPNSGTSGAISVKDSAGAMAAAIARDISKDGPMAWLRYFDDASPFFMASDGQLVFPDHQAASKFISEVLVRQIRHIDLKWNNLRIDSLTTGMALIASDFHEDITDSTGKSIAFDGYFTGIAQQTPGAWKLRDAHWSIKHPGK